MRLRTQAFCDSVYSFGTTLRGASHEKEKKESGSFLFGLFFCGKHQAGVQGHFLIFLIVASVLFVSMFSLLSHGVGGAGNSTVLQMMISLPF